MNSSTPQRQTWLFAAAVLALAALALGYLGWKSDSRPAPPGIDKLSVAVPTLPHAALLHIAVEKGYFSEEGLDLTSVPASHGKAALDLVIEHKVDLAAAAEVPFLLAIMKGESIGTAASVLSVSNDSTVVARRDRGISAPRDLVGKKIGVTLGTSGEYFLWAFMIRHKLAPDSVTLVNIPPGKTAQALVDGSIDAAATWQPIVFDAQTALGKNAVSFTETQAYLFSRPLAFEQMTELLLREQNR